MASLDPSQVYLLGVIKFQNSWSQEVEMYDPDKDALHTVPFDVAICDFEDAGTSLIEKITKLKGNLDGKPAQSQLSALQEKVATFATLQSLVLSIREYLPKLEAEEASDDNHTESLSLRDRARVLDEVEAKLNGLVPEIAKARDEYIHRFPLETRKSLAEHFPGIRTGFSPKRSSLGPEHFEEILNEAVDFFDRDGMESRMTLHEAAFIFIDVLDKFSRRIIPHIGKEELFEKDRVQFEKVKVVWGKIKTAVSFFEQDREAFRPDDSSRLISTREDLDAMSQNLKNTISYTKMLYTEFLCRVFNL